MFHDTPLSGDASLPHPLLPPFSSRHFSHLPTPQSPNALGPYPPQYPQSPVQLPSSSLQPSSFVHRIEDVSHRNIDGNQQCITPDSSPFVSRSTPPYHNNPAEKPHYYIAHSQESVSVDSSRWPVKSEPGDAPRSASSHRVPSPTYIKPDQVTHPSGLSSPFMAKVPVSDLHGKDRGLGHPIQTSTLVLPEADDVFSSSGPPASSTTQLAISTPPVSPPRQVAEEAIQNAGGEMERIRQAMIEEQLLHFREAESRRPDYLKRAKRSLSEADPLAFEEDESVRDRDRGVLVGITESPNKGRRLKLFQETSEESFEESLMAGGYGRYRTADWVRQPQPISLPIGGIAGPSNIVSLLEEVEEAPPSEKELKKRNRLNAFRSEHSKGRSSNTKLYPVELEGKGRVLIDMPNEEHVAPGSPEPSSSKKRGGKRKKKGTEPTAKEKKALADSGGLWEEALERPNWPDAEFPWRLRTEERAEMAKAEEEERMRWIERFLDRDTDDEDEESSLGNDNRADDEDDELLPSAKWGLVYEDETDRPVPAKMGRGKMVPLLAHPEDSRKTHIRKRSVFPSDPADARAALLSKKSVRALSYRQQRRQREQEDDSDEEVVCICNGRDDGRELVQCDGCQTWYHLQCIGIRNIAELGKEEDPWFCDGCVSRSRSPSTEPEDIAPVIYREPTFVPTDDEPRMHRSVDAPFFQPQLPDSPIWNPPRIPKTPTRGGRFGSGSDLEFSSASSSRLDPSTPQHRTQGARVYTNGSPGLLDGYEQNYEEAPFDPTSTPSRGIRIGASFATPKNSLWSSKASGLFHTPSKATGRTSSRTFGGPGSLSSALDDSGGSHELLYNAYGRTSTYDESPIRRNKAPEGRPGYRVLDSPLISRSKGTHGQSSLEESPIMRTKGKERFRQRDMILDDEPR